jgi:Arc/MetJ-type ribon-helix-helix transcriptional regulator
MTTQIAVGLPDEIVEFLDRLVAQGAAKSSAAAVTRALDQDRRRRMAEHDAAIRSLHVARFGQAPKAGESNMEIAVSDVVSDRFSPRVDARSTGQGATAGPAPDGARRTTIPAGHTLTSG